MIKSDNPVVQEITTKLIRLEYEQKIEPVKTTVHGGTKLFMERISGSSLYLSHLRKVIYDVKFENTYYHNNKVPENCFAVDNMILRIEDQACVGIQFPFDSDPEKFLEILSRPIPVSKGTRIYLDHVLYMDNVPFARADSIRNNLLQQRKEGTLVYQVLRIINQSGNVTEFHASPAVQKRMKALANGD